MFLDILPPMLQEIEVDLMEDAEAKCSLVWCMGEFGEQLPDVKEKLLFFVEYFDDQPTSVQVLHASQRAQPLPNTCRAPTAYCADGDCEVLPARACDQRRDAERM